jgi:DNA-binding winged helix-turn-helix (wHTH) protein
VTVALSLLEDVRWRGNSVVGERPRSLLAALATGAGRPVRAEELIELVWGDEAPANATKSLQVLVSRTRSACGADAIVRDGIGYRLGVAPGEVDSLRLTALVREATASLDRDAVSAAAPPSATRNSTSVCAARRRSSSDAAMTSIRIETATNSRPVRAAAALPATVANVPHSSTGALTPSPLHSLDTLGAR